jgi:hypothetical protein
VSDELGIDFVEVHQGVRLRCFDKTELDLDGAPDVGRSSRRYEISRERLSQANRESQVSTPSTVCIQTHLIIGVIKRIDPLLPEPIIQRQHDLAQILLLEHILVPNEELDDAKFIGEGEVEREIKCSIFGQVDGVGVAFENWGVEAGAEEGNDDESVQGRL